VFLYQSQAANRVAAKAAFLEEPNVMSVMVINIQLETVLIIGDEAGALTFQIALVTQPE
jgi:hypothetical protein